MEGNVLTSGKRGTKARFSRLAAKGVGPSARPVGHDMLSDRGPSGSRCEVSLRRSDAS